MSSRRLQDVLKDKKMLYWRRLQDVFKTSSVRLHYDECLLGNCIKPDTAQKLKFSLRISSVNATKSAVSSGFGYIYWILQEERQLLCIETKTIHLFQPFSVWCPLKGHAYSNNQIPEYTYSFKLCRFVEYVWPFSEHQALKTKSSKASGFKNFHRKENLKKLDNILR